jgi:hypothetical protein
MRYSRFLAAEHIQGRPFPEIISFVSVRSGEPLWRNFIAHLVSLLARPTEVEALVAAIESARAGDTTREDAVNRDVLLADIAFTWSRKPPATAQRLVDGAFATIERGDWLLARREVLRSALTNLDDTASQVDDRMARWAPRRQKYLARLFDALASWGPTDELCSVLIGRLYDEDRDNQRSAARTLGRIFAGRVDVERRLRTTIGSTLDLSVTGAVLEALTIGWPETPNLSELHDRAFASQGPTLRFVGISGRLSSGRVNLTDRDALVALLSVFSLMDFSDQPTARRLLSKHWPDDPALIDLAFKAVRRCGPLRPELEPETAIHYLLHCSPSNPSVLSWMRHELTEQYPFLLAHDDPWDFVAPFAFKHADIRMAVLAVISSDWGRHSLFRLPTPDSRTWRRRNQGRADRDRP